MPKTIFLDVYKNLKKRIRNGEWKKKVCLPGEKELLADLGVSKATLRKVLDKLAGEGLLFPVPGKGTFLEAEGAEKYLNKSAPPPRIGLLFPTDDTRLPNQITASIIEFCSLIGIELIQPDIPPEDGSGQRATKRLAQLLERQVGGVILFHTSHMGDSLTAMLEEAMKPYVVVDAYPPHPVKDMVLSNNREGGTLLAKYLMRLGHRRFVYINDSVATRSSTKERFEGFCYEVGQARDTHTHTLTVDREKQKQALAQRVHLEPMDFSTALLMEYIQGPWKKLPPTARPTAFVGENSEATMAALMALQRCGVSVPKMVSVGGFDLPSHPLQGLTPTVCEQDGRAIGRCAAELLYRRLKQPAAPPSHILVPMRLSLGNTDQAAPIT